MVQHPSDWHNNTGVIRQAEEQEMGVILMRPQTSGVFQRLMAEAWAAGTTAIEIDAVSRDGAGGGRLLLKTVLSDPYVDVALVGGHETRGHGTCHGEPRFMELNNEISDDVEARIDLAKLHDRHVR